MGTKFFEIKNVTITGNNDLIKNDIVKHLYNLKGQSIFNISTNELSSDLLNDVRVKDVLISRSFPDTLKIKIDQRTPLGIIYRNDQYIYVDENLNPFAYYSEIKDVELPILFLEEKDEENFKVLLSNLSKSKIYPLVSEVYSMKDGYTLTLLDGTDVYTDKDVDTNKYELGYKIYTKEKETKNLEYLELRFRDIAVK
jgi:polypeptide-transport-associated domain protein ftsQ-type